MGKHISKSLVTRYQIDLWKPAQIYIPTRRLGVGWLLQLLPNVILIFKESLISAKMTDKTCYLTVLFPSRNSKLFA